MADNSESFASVDQITSRPNYLARLEITVDSFSSLIGRYHLSESVKCQVKTEYGICGQKHQRGYVGVTKEGKEGLIGGICGDKYFKEHTLFVQEKNRIDAEIDRRENIEKLIVYKESFLSLSGVYGALSQNIQTMKKKTNHLYNGFPDIVLTYLYQAQKTKNWDLNVDVLRHTRGEKGMTSNWYIEKLCTFPPLPSAQEIQSLLGRVENLKTIFSEACSSNIEELSTPKLKGYVRSLSDFYELENIYTKFDKDVEEFTQDHTLYNLYYACANNKDKLATIKTILTANNSNLSEQLVKYKCDEIERITKEKFDNCQVRYNKTVMKFKKNSIG
ncbi:hypothetical protein ABU553_000609 [Yersinia enterocolitica]|uniref:hypothetical protein n=1 Tax=Yersinia enterocolitica TaxID=630 RepID=UPI0006247BAE|nr:hypothetical protein [Yersinia enterocolitica]AKF38573.1 hypothetical protein FORC2_2426 [Yersinia enterocolitica]ALG44845.1 hypothetical protein LI89_08925 [Yersinia enterocolitica]